jgi:hypothetical protein
MARHLALVPGLGVLALLAGCGGHKTAPAPPPVRVSVATPLQRK